MKVCVVGAGAVGGLMAARLVASMPSTATAATHAGHTVSVLARGATLAAIRDHGIVVHTPVAGSPGHYADAAFAVAASDDPAALGPQDLVIIALKYNALAALAPRMAPLMHQHTTVLTAMNGVPWWFPLGLSGEGARLQLPSVDPDGAISRALDPARVVGCVVHLASSTRGPAHIQHDVGNRLIVGEPSHQRTDRLTRIAALLQNAGFDVDVSDDIHREVWYKLWGNLTMNPVSALTGAHTGPILSDPLLKGFLVAMMTEAARVGARIGVPIAEDPRARLAVAAGLGSFRTSMLQDAQAGRELEVDALVTAVVEIAQQLDEPVPFIEALLGMVRVFAANQSS